MNNILRGAVIFFIVFTSGHIIGNKISPASVNNCIESLINLHDKMLTENNKNDHDELKNLIANCSATPEFNEKLHAILKWQSLSLSQKMVAYLPLHWNMCAGLVVVLGVGYLTYAISKEPPHSEIDSILKNLKKNGVSDLSEIVDDNFKIDDTTLNKTLSESKE
jgi:hypothetical protein